DVQAGRQGARISTETLNRIGIALRHGFGTGEKQQEYQYDQDGNENVKTGKAHFVSRRCCIDQQAHGKATLAIPCWLPHLSEDAYSLRFTRRLADLYP